LTKLKLPKNIRSVWFNWKSRFTQINPSFYICNISKFARKCSFSAKKIAVWKRKVFML